MEFLSKDEIVKYIHKDIDIEIFDKIDSTNTESLRQLKNGLDGYKIILSYEQTSGRGRIGRKFYSPKYNGIYMSIIIPYKDINPLAITSKAAVAVAKSLEDIVDEKIYIKWVNDLIVQDKKICGILTEGFIDYKTNKLKNIVVGIGINLNNTNYYLPDDLKDIVKPLDFNKNINYSKLIADIFNNLISDYDFLDYYRDNSYILNKDIYYIKNNRKFYAKAIDIDKDGSLIVLNSQGETIKLNTGEISIRKLEK